MNYWMHRTERRSFSAGVSWWTLFPFRLVMEILVTLFDMVLSRFLIAAIVVGVIWLPIHLAIDVGSKFWVWSSFVLGVVLMGLWDGCDVLSIRPYIPHVMLIHDERSE